MKAVYGRSIPGCRRTGRGERLEQLCESRIEPCERAMQRWQWMSLVVAALVLAGCGSGGGIPMGDAGGDAGELSLPDKWRQFEEGVPTLRMTRAQLFDAWRSVARQSTHRVSLASPVGIGTDPASPIPVDTSPTTFPVDAEACLPGDCDLEPPAEGTWAFAPVLRHNDIPVAKLTSRFTRTDNRFTDIEILEAADSAGLGEDRRGLDETLTVLFDFLVDSLAYGGWLDCTQFNVSHTRWCIGG